MGRQTIDMPVAEIAAVCRRYQVRELAVFGSYLRDDFRPDSDIDLLVEFAPDAEIGFLLLSRMGRELTHLLHRPVDLVSKNGLKPSIREEVLSSRRIVYAS